MVYLTTEGHRRIVPLVENVRLDVVPEFGLEIKEVEGGRLVTLRLNRGDNILGEMLLYQYIWDTWSSKGPLYGRTYSVRTARSAGTDMNRVEH